MKTGIAEVEARLQAAKYTAVEINGERFDQWGAELRSAVGFKMGLVSTSINNMIADGEKLEDIMPHIEKRRELIKLAELLEGVAAAPNSSDQYSVPAMINGYQLSNEMAAAFRQALMAYTYHHARFTAVKNMVAQILELMKINHPEQKTEESPS